MKSCRLAALIVTTVIALNLALPTSAVSTLTSAAEAFRTRVDDLEFAQYVARTALLAEEKGSREAHLLELVDILLGSEEDPTSGLLHWVESGMGDPILRELVRPSSRDDFETSLDYVEGYLNVALKEAQIALDVIDKSLDPKPNIQAAFSFLSSALGNPEETMSLGGLRVAASFLPTVIALIGPDQSIADAAVQLDPGSVLFLDTGEYDQGTIVLSTSVWLARYPYASSVVRLVGDGTTPVLIVAENAQVELSDLTLCRGSTGLLLQKEAVAHISSSRFIDNSNAGVVVSDKASATIQDSSIRNNRSYGLLVTDVATAFVSKSDISLNVSTTPGAEGAGILTQDDATVTGTHCELFANRGYGIWGQDKSTIVLSGSRVIYSRNGGIHLQGDVRLSLIACHVAINGRTDISVHVQACVEEWGESWNPANAFVGSIEGYGNTTDTSFGGLRTCLGAHELPTKFFVDSKQ